MPSLSVYKNRDHLFNYYMEKDEIVIGRSHDADIPLDSNAVSRSHVRIRRQGLSFVAEDLSGKTGMFVNGEYKSMQILKDGDQIEIAQHLLVFHRPDSEIAEEQVDRGMAQKLFMSSTEVEKILDNAASGRLEDPAQQVDSILPTTLLSANDIQRIKEATALRRRAHLALAGGGSRREIPLDDTIKLIGWTGECDVRLPGSPFFKKAVAQISPTSNGQYRIEALSNWRPVKVGGEKIKERVLEDADTIEVGGIKLRFRSAVD